jgi:hypothetical protein
MSDAEGKILKIYDKSKPEDEDLHDLEHNLHWVWGWWRSWSAWSSGSASPS